MTTAMWVRSPFLSEPSRSGVSNSSPLALCKDHDSVDKNEKDFAKFKDSVGEEDNTDSDPKVENDKDFAPPIKKLKVDKDVIYREIFDKWCKGWGIKYGDVGEKECRFAIFQKNLKLAKTVKELNNLSEFADHNQEELDACYAFTFGDKPDDIFNEEDFAKLKDSVGEDNTDSDPKVGNEKDFSPPIKKLNVDKDVTSLSDEEIFDIWCNFLHMTYEDDKEKQYRFSIFRKALKPPKTEDELHPNYPTLADRTEGELNGANAYIFKSDLEIMASDIYIQSEE